MLQLLMNEVTLEKTIYLQKLSFLYKELPKAVLATLFLGLLLVIVLKEDIPIERLVIWYSLTVVVSVLRFTSLLYFHFDKNKEIHLQRFSNFLFLGSILSGLLWGSCSIFIFPASDELKLIILFCIAGLSAGATGSLSAVFKVYLSFVLLSILPFIIIFSLEATSYGIFISAALIFYLLAISFTALDINRNYDKTLHLVSENESLVEELKDKVDLAEKASEAKSMFLSNMSHELRTPLNAILGYISILRKKEKDIEKQHKLEIIEHSSHLLLGVINDILDISKISSGKLRLELLNCNLKEELEKLQDLFIPLCREKNIILELDLDDAIPACVLTDSLRLNQILTNLLSNAIKFTHKGKKVTLICKYENGRLVFEVIDEGIGINEEQQSVIFESFEQADNSTTRKYGGTGLGLSISYQLVLLFGSKLEVFSKLEEGSKFFFSIGVEPCEEIEDEVLDDDEEEKFAQQKILVAEDNMTNQMLIQLLLEDLNLNVVMVSDGREAFESYSNDFALVLMDINMPNMNGIEAMQEIKRKFPEAKIVALTANALNEDKEKYIRLGFDEYIAKPIDTKALIKILKSILQPQ